MTATLATSGLTAVLVIGLAATVTMGLTAFGLIVAGILPTFIRLVPGGLTAAGLVASVLTAAARLTTPRLVLRLWRLAAVRLAAFRMAASTGLAVSSGLAAATRLTVSDSSEPRGGYAGDRRVESAGRPIQRR